MNINECHWIDTPVRPGDLDVVGHVNNARVLELLEYGRIKWLESQDWAPRTNVAAVVTRIEVDYIREIGLCTPVINTQFTSEQGIDLTKAEERDFCYRVVFKQSIKEEPENETAYINAEVTVSFIDTEKRTLVSLNEYIE